MDTWTWHRISPAHISSLGDRCSHVCGNLEHWFSITHRLITLSYTTATRRCIVAFKGIMAANILGVMIMAILLIVIGRQVHYSLVLQELKFHCLGYMSLWVWHTIVYLLGFCSSLLSSLVGRSTLAWWWRSILCTLYRIRRQSTPLKRSL